MIGGSEVCWGTCQLWCVGSAPFGLVVCAFFGGMVKWNGGAFADSCE